MAEAVALEFDTYKNQMKAICEASVLMGSGQFCSFDEEEFLSKVKDLTKPIMVLEPITYRWGDSHTEYIVEYMKCGFSIYLPKLPHDFVNNDIAMRDCKVIARKVMSRIRKNTFGRYTGEGIAPFRNLKAETVRGEPQALTADGRIGFYTEFEIHYQISLAYNSNDWTD